MPRSPLLALLIALPALAASASAATPDLAEKATASAVAVSVSVPGLAGGIAGTASAPPDEVSPVTGYGYPVDGSAVSVASAGASASSTTGQASAAADISGISILGGEITVASIAARARASATSGGASGSFDGAAVDGLTVLGQPVAATAGVQIPLGDWGYAVVNQQSGGGGSASAPSYRVAMTALAVHLTADHAGLPAGTEIRLGYAEASAEAAAAPPPPPATTSVPTTKPATTTAPPPPPPPKTTAGPPPPPPPPPPTTRSPRPTAQQPRPAAKQPETRPSAKPDSATPASIPTRGRRPVLQLAKPPEPPEAAPGAVVPRVVTAPPPAVQPKLTAGGYVFPVYGPASYSDTFLGPRANVGWHHGEDIFAPLGAPVLAVADGWVYSVGWNRIGGYRLWLRDRQGNEFYYAHLSAYAPAAVNGRYVKAGTVLAFVGNTGDALGTPFHLHFEIHPVSLLHLGYDGVVNPNPYLNGWRRLEDVPFLPAPRWAPPPPVAAPADAGADPAEPQLGASVIFLGGEDISTASNLDPEALARTLAAGLEGDAALVGFEPEPPDGAHPVRHPAR